MLTEAVGSIIAGLIGAFATIAAALMTRQTPRWPRRGRGSERAFLFGVAVFGAIVGVLGLAGYRKAERFLLVDEQMVSFRQLVADGESDTLQYVLPAITMMVNLERAGTSRDSRLEADVRITYLVHALKDFQGDGLHFEEEYHSLRADSVVHLPASEPDSISDHSNHKGQKSLVKFKVRAGQRRLVTTGARYFYPLELPTRGAHYFPELGPKEDAFCYPNTANDQIGNLLIMVESRTLDLHLDPKGGPNAGIQNAGAPNIRVTPNLFTETAASSRRTVVSAHFDELRPGAAACLKVQWS